MNISGYRFGKIDVGGRTYTSDVIITPERVIDGWWRQQGHALAVADLDDVLVGQGFFGLGGSDASNDRESQGHQRDGEPASVHLGLHLQMRRPAAIGLRFAPPAYARALPAKW